MDQQLTAANNGSKTEGRAADGTFAIGNPGGGKRPGKTIVREMREAFAAAGGPEKAQKVAAQIYELAINSKEPSVKLAACKLFVEAYGLPPPQEIHVQQAVALLSEEERDTLALHGWRISP